MPPPIGSAGDAARAAAGAGGDAAGAAGDAARAGGDAARASAAAGDAARAASDAARSAAGASGAAAAAGDAARAAGDAAAAASDAARATGAPPVLFKDASGLPRPTTKAEATQQISQVQKGITEADAASVKPPKNPTDTELADSRSVQEEFKNSKPETKESALSNAADWVKNNPGKILMGLGAVAIAAYALYQYDKSTNTQRTITKIEQDDTGFFSDKKKLKITFTPGVRITKTDLITMSGTKTTPSLDVTDASVTDVLSDNQIIYTSPKVLTNMTEGGTINVKTSFGSQLGDMAGQTIRNVATTAGDAGGSFFSSLFGGNMGTWIIIIIVIVFVMIMLALFL